MGIDPQFAFLHTAVRQAPGPLYLAVADAIGQAIGRRELSAGDRLPPQRQLAIALQVDLTTITRAYAEARRRGLLDAQVGRGTFVRDAGEPTAAPEPNAPALLDMSMNCPRCRLRACCGRCCKQGSPNCSATRIRAA